MEKPILDEIWILSDNRAGNYSQAIGLATELGLNQKIVNISYGVFSLLPNLFLRSSLFGLDKKTKLILKKLDHFPKMIIAAGRRSAPISLYLKKQSENKTKIIQIMNPDSNFDDFDFVILPRHDRVRKYHRNIIRTLGALNKINEIAVKYECEKFADIFNKSQKPKIALFIGGKSKKTNFGIDSTKKLIENSAKITKNMQAQLLVLNSRRTGEKNTKIIEEFLKKSNCDFQFFDHKKYNGEKNPYLAIIGFADYFIVSGDSVSMISEACSTGKPVYIFDEEKISSKKHKIFHKQLLLENFARKLNDDTKFLEKFSTKKLDEAKRVALIIKNALGLNYKNGL